MNTLKNYAPVITRIGLALVFLWFGVDQFLETANYVGYIPDSILQLIPIGTVTFVHLNGIFEIVFGTALLLGFYTRITALLLALHLLDILYVVWPGQIATRDFGLVVATTSIFFYGADIWSLDRYIESN